MSGPIVLALRLLMAAALYAFLGWALWAIWRDLNQEGQKVLRNRVPEIRLAGRAGRRAGRARAFSQAEVILGRDPSCDLPLDDATASARHTKLSYHHGHWWVEDLNSRNGTRLNKARVTIP